MTLFHQEHGLHEHGHQGRGHFGHGLRRRSQDRRRLTVAALLAGGYMVAEVVGGWISGSLALLADAGHMLSDVAALGLSLFAVWMADRPPAGQRTYGYYRTEILVALVNGAALVAISVLIFVEAFQRISEPPAVVGGVMMVVAAGGLLVNLIGLWLLREGKEKSLNLRGAWLHILTDALGSVGAIAAGGLILAFDWRWADPVASTLIGLLVVYSSWRLIGESVSVLMENAPRGIDVDAVRAAILGQAGVVDVHDLHVWTITSGLDSLSAHVVVEDGLAAAVLLRELHATLVSRFGIEHMTVQIEPPDFEKRACRRCW